MFDKLANGWRLGMQAFGVLRTDKKLLIFPLLSGIACLIIMASFALPLVLSKSFRNMMDNGEAPNDILIYLLLFVLYFLTYFVIIFFNSALVACALVRFNGGEPTLGDGFNAAASRMPQILGWALVSATVGLILKIIEDRSEKVGQFVAGLLGMAWSVMTYFVVPVLVVEKTGPIEAVKRSCSIIGKTWGESLVANFGVGLMIFLLFLAALIPAGLGFLMGGAALVVGLVITALLVIVVSLISSAVHTIITAALYQYAAEDRIPQQFEADLLQTAFVKK